MNAAKYDRALKMYRAGRPLPEIAERLGLSIDAVTEMEQVGDPAMNQASFRELATDRVTRIRNHELDWSADVAEMAAVTGHYRRLSAVAAAKIEQALMASWQADAAKKIEDAKARGELPDPLSLCQPKAVLDTLRALRACQDPVHDVNVGKLFALMHGADPENQGAGGRGIDQLARELEGLTREQQEEYVRTGVMPDRSRQRTLPFPTPETAAAG